jgi:hypothetical protein
LGRLGVVVFRVSVLRTILVALVLGAWSLVPSAQAAPLTIDTIGGIWENPIVSRGPKGLMTGNGTATIEWGSPKRRLPKSGYLWNGGQPITVMNESSFLLGMYTHRNSVIRSKSQRVNQADLALNISGTLGGQVFNLANLFRFDHDETLNSERPCKRGRHRECGDIVNIVSLITGPIVIRQGNTVFTLLIDGFVETLGGPIITQFMTRERSFTNLYLQARLIVETDPAPIPLPPAGLALMAGLAGLGLVARRRKAA